MLTPVSYCSVVYIVHGYLKQGITQNEFHTIVSFEASQNIVWAAPKLIIEVLYYKLFLSDTLFLAPCY